MHDGIDHGLTYGILWVFKGVFAEWTVQYASDAHVLLRSVQGFSEYLGDGAVE